MRLATAYAARRPAESLAWGWEDGIFLYGVEKLRARLPEDQRAPWRAYLERYHATWARRGVPKIDRSDLCPPALTALALARDGCDVGRASMRKVAEYIAHATKNSIGALDHLGTSALRMLYPRAIWVDSLMMYAVFAAQWGVFADDDEMLHFGTAQPAVFASRLQDEVDGLFRHAWLERFDRVVPHDAAYWLRGNGWVVVAIVEILDALPPDHARHAELARLLDRVARALVRHQRPDGAWTTLVNRPTYVETSGTSLVAYAIAKGVGRGWLAPELASAATRAIEHVTRAIASTTDGVSMPSISAATNALASWTYDLVPRRENLAYGVGAYLMAASVT